MNACVLVKVVPTKAEGILKSVKESKHVKKAYLSYGRFDLVCFLEVQDYPEVREVSSMINKLEGVRSTETLVEA